MMHCEKVTHSENATGKLDSNLVILFISNCPATNQSFCDLDSGILANRISIAKFPSTGNKRAPCTTQAAGAGQYMSVPAAGFEIVRP